MTPAPRAEGRGALGVVLLVHADFGRAEELIRHWARAGCPVVVHVDVAVPRPAHDAFRARLEDLPAVLFSPRHRCEWGTWGIVAATQGSCELMLARFPDVRHVFLASGSCLPLRPVAALQAYLAARPGTDLIESVTTADVPWTVGGLSDERFTLRFPFSFRRRRRLFDGYVRLQRRWGMRRRLPPGIAPHMGSQWWCLTRATLQAILGDPDRPALDRYFRRVWIPDESYFQTLARRHGARIESRSLTLSKFDFAGKPHVFYDDHLQLLRRSDCFVARKIWPGADRLYRAFLQDGEGAAGEPQPAKIDRVLARALDRRTRGRPGLWMQSRFPTNGGENGVTAAPYSVFEGFAELFEDWEGWLARATGARVHGHLFAPGGAEFEGRGETFAGAQSRAPALRDYAAQAFLTNLLWNTRGRRQIFQFGPRDNQAVSWDLAKDPNAQVSVVSGAWAVPLWREGRPLAEVRGEAARLQKREAEHLNALRSRWARARVRIWTLAEFVEDPRDALLAVLDEMGPVEGRAEGMAGGPRAGEARAAEARAAETGAAETGAGEAPRLPPLADLAGFGRFLQDLRNQGMHPYLMGDFPADPAPAAIPAGPATPFVPAGPAEPAARDPAEAPARPPRRPYLVR